MTPEPASPAGIDPEHMDELQAARAWLDAWTRLDAAPLAALLTEDARYTSMWVMEDLVGRESIIRHLQGKFEAVRRLGPEGAVTATLAVSTASWPGRPCVDMAQGTTRAAVLFQMAAGRLAGCDICIHEILRPRPLPADLDG